MQVKITVKQHYTRKLTIVVDAASRLVEALEGHLGEEDQRQAENMVMVQAREVLPLMPVEPEGEEIVLLYP